MSCQGGILKTSYRFVLFLTVVLVGCAKTPLPAAPSVVPSPYLAKIEALRAQQGKTVDLPSDQQAAPQAPLKEYLTQAKDSGLPEPDSRLLWHFLPKQTVPTARQQQTFSFWQAQQGRALRLQVGPVGDMQSLESARLAIKRAQHLQKWLAGQAITATVRYAPELPANQVLWLTERGE